MLSFKGGFKYIALLMVAGWMFFLGLLVGRGTSPVTFDTQNFQDRLAVIAGKYQDLYPGQKKVELDFYQSLSEPVVVERIIKDPQPRAVVTRQVPAAPEKTAEEKSVDAGPAEPAAIETVSREIPVKTSLKHMTVLKTGPVTAAPPSTDTPSTVVEAAVEKKQDGPMPYTVQVASYSNFQDALAHMTALEKKGFAAYRTMWKNNDQTWYRVRTGAFPSMEDAKQYLDTLNGSDIKGMIIKRTDDENIQE